ncbi:aspartate/glutamate racemase family protein [Mesorhizobium wenxiniae]|uniref:Asp/Glu racemase n=1 Tax=Mesorhizobium wenxiniae TaxID=2014805 RepID=A0A271KA64_9HYPH|nr:aspartate/glutamate racemase family protein [Mesorhizobium wenxiniae]PAP92067.1 Asp/Glu racemase [Mesorhizobium wenxiniae]
MTIYILNPNSSQTVTDGIDRAVEPLRRATNVSIRCRTLHEGPPGIETQAHVDGVVAPLLDHCRALEETASAFVIACFSDPGLASLREQSNRPVFGIAESGILTAMTLGQRFGIIAILERSIPRHLRYVGAMGVTDRLAGDLPLNLTVAELSDRTATFERLKIVGSTLRKEKNADVLILGCAGMASLRSDLEAELKCPVVDPCEAAATMAVGRVAFAQLNKKEISE